MRDEVIKEKRTKFGVEIIINQVKYRRQLLQEDDIVDLGLLKFKNEKEKAFRK